METQRPKLDLSDITTSLVRQLDDKKRQYLIHIVKELFNKPINEKTGKRITRQLFEGKPNYERYVWDFGKKSERFLMEWEIIWPNDINTVNYMPTIEVSAPISVLEIMN